MEQAKQHKVKGPYVVAVGLAFATFTWLEDVGTGLGWTTSS